MTNSNDDIVEIGTYHHVRYCIIPSHGEWAFARQWLLGKQPFLTISQQLPKESAITCGENNMRHDMEQYPDAPSVAIAFGIRRLKDLMNYLAASYR